MPVQPLTRNAAGVQSLRKSAAACSAAVRAWRSSGDEHVDPTARALLQIQQDISGHEVTLLSVSLDYHELLLLNREGSDPKAQASCRKHPDLLA